MTYLIAIFASVAVAIFTAFYMHHKTLPKPQNGTVEASSLPDPATALYNVAAGNLGQHLTLDPSVPDDVGCAEAVSACLEQAGYTNLPPKGLAGVNALIEWMEGQGFVEAPSAAPGYVITAHNPDKSVTTFAHTGICLKYGIASNTSSNGIFSENYSYGGWDRYFGVHGSTTRYFCPVEKSA